MKSKGFTCVDCNCYIVPPQNYNPKTIKLCKCYAKASPIRSAPPVLRKNDMAIERTIMRLVRIDEAREEVISKPVLIPMKRSKPSLRSILRHVAAPLNPKQYLP